VEGRRKRTNVDATGHGCRACVVVVVAGDMNLCEGFRGVCVWSGVKRMAFAGYSNACPPSSVRALLQRRSLALLRPVRAF